MCPQPDPERTGPSPTEVHPYEFASRRTFELFFRLLKRALALLAAIVIVGIVLLIIVLNI